MSINSLGNRFKITSFGESHGKCIGAVIDGCPAGLPIIEKDIQEDVNRRRPGKSIISTSRSEQDKIEVISGVFRGKTTGAPICMLVWNKDIDSSQYELTRNIPRPGHADYPAKVKFNGFEDYRGGGRFSARSTVGFVMAGSIAKALILKTLRAKIIAYTSEIGGIKSKKLPLAIIEEQRFKNDVKCPDFEAGKKMGRTIENAKQMGDSVGGVIECIVKDIQPGLGEPLFGALDSELSKALFSIPAVKSVGFGSGLNAASAKGSENNDEYRISNGKIVTTTNNSGGILGGISTGMPLIIRIAFKPTSSIAQKQKSVNLKKFTETKISVKGRHDPCVVPRAVPIVEAMVALVIADLGIIGGFIPPIFEGDFN